MKHLNREGVSETEKGSDNQRSIRMRKGQLHRNKPRKDGEDKCKQKGERNPNALNPRKGYSSEDEEGAVTRRSTAVKSAIPKAESTDEVRPRIRTENAERRAE